MSDTGLTFSKLNQTGNLFLTGLSSQTDPAKTRNLEGNHTN